MENSLRLNVMVKPGSVIGKAFGDAIRLANHIGCEVEFVFNGVRCLAVPGGSIMKGIKAYERECAADEKSYYARN